MAYIYISLDGLMIDDLISDLEYVLRFRDEKSVNRKAEDLQVFFLPTLYICMYFIMALYYRCIHTHSPFRLFLSLPLPIPHLPSNNNNNTAQHRTAPHSNRNMNEAPDDQPGQRRVPCRSLHG